MTDETINQDNPEADGESSPYIAQMLGHDQHEADLQRMIRDRGRMVIMLFLVLAGSVYSNAYQLTLPKNVPYINNVTESGQVVTRILLRPSRGTTRDPQQPSLDQTAHRRLGEGRMDSLKGYGPYGGRD